MLLWRVRLARYRRRAEREAITTALEHVSAQQAQLVSQREGDYWKAQLHKAAEQEGEGIFMTAVYALAASLVSGVFGKAGSGKGGAASITTVHEDDDPDKPLITDPQRVVKAVAEFSERMNEPRTSNVAVTMGLLRVAGWIVAGDGAQPQGRTCARGQRPGQVSIGLTAGAAPRPGDTSIDENSVCGNMFGMGEGGRDERLRPAICRLFAAACLDPQADVVQMAREAGATVVARLTGPRALEQRVAAIEQLADNVRKGDDVRLLCHCCDDERPQRRVQCHGEHYRGLIERLARMPKEEAADVLRGRRDEPGAAPASAARWQAAVDIFTEDAYDLALGRMRVRQAVGIDGWRGVLLRWSAGWARDAYLTALRGMMAAWGGWPVEWYDWLVTMIEKKGKDPRIFGNLRDIWQSCHGWKIFTGMTRLQYQASGDASMPNYASGFRQRRNAMEAVLTTVLAGEQAAAVCAPMARGYIDLSGFFMGVSQNVAYAMAHAVGVPPSVSECMYSFASGLNGRVDTGALGLTPRFSVTQGLGQGCSNAPDRAMIDLLPTQLTAARLVPGFGFVSRAWRRTGSKRWVLMGWFADDANALQDRPLLLVLFLDVAWMASFVSGNRFGVDSKGRKTAITQAYCDATRGLLPETTNWKVLLPDGREVPMFASRYCLLGNDVSHSVDGESVLNMIEHREQRWQHGSYHAQSAWSAPRSTCCSKPQAAASSSTTDAHTPSTLPGPNAWNGSAARPTAAAATELGTLHAYRCMRAARWAASEQRTSTHARRQPSRTRSTSR